MFGIEINEAYLEKVYDDFSKEQNKLMESIKQCQDSKKEQDITKQITQISSLMMAILRFRNLKRKLALKMLE